MQSFQEFSSYFDISLAANFMAGECLVVVDAGLNFMNLIEILP